MPKALLARFSQTGATTLVSQQIAKGLSAAGWQVDLHDIAIGLVSDRPEPSLDGYNLLGIGTPTYFYRPPFVVQEYVRALPGLGGLASFVFVLHGTHQGACGNQIRTQLRVKGARDVGYYHCSGADYWMGYLKRGYLFSPDAPAASDLAAAEAFGASVAQRCRERTADVEAFDGPIPLIYNVERALTVRPLARLISSRIFRADQRCDRCGLCIERCPVANITLGKDGAPDWHSNCLLCATCQLICPQDAIRSAFDWLVFAPFVRYNIQKAIRTYPYARVEHARGETRRV